MLPDGFRCKTCERILTDDELGYLECVDCGSAGDWQPRDVVLNPVTGNVFVAVWDRYGKRCEWIELAPMGHSQLNPPKNAVLLVRWKDATPLPVVDLGTGDLFAVETVA